jgi:hypothetical protein
MKRINATIFLGLMFCGASFADMVEKPGVSGQIFGSFNYDSLIIESSGITYLKLWSGYDSRWIWIDATTDLGLVQSIEIINARKANAKNFVFAYEPSQSKGVPNSGSVAYMKLTSLLYK